MNPEEVKALIEEAVGNFIAPLRDEFTKANQGLAASLTKEIKRAVTTQQPQPAETDAVDETGKLSLRALQKQLGDLQTELANKAQETFNAKKSQAVIQAITATNALNTSALQKLITLEFGNCLKEESGNWFVEKGDSVIPLKDALNSYLATDEGKFYLPPSGVSGSGSTEAKNVTVDSTQKLEAADALYDAF